MAIETAKACTELTPTETPFQNLKEDAVKKWKGHANDFFSEQWLEG
jgi:hypothetical protein